MKINCAICGSENEVSCRYSDFTCKDCDQRHEWTEDMVPVITDAQRRLLLLGSRFFDHVEKG